MAVALLAAVSGCTDDAGPKPQPLPSSTSSSAASPSPTPPELPQAAKSPGTRGAKAFANHYVELVTYALKTGDTKALTDASQPTCQSCKAIVENIALIYGSGGSIESDGWRLAHSRVIQANDRRAVVSLDLNLAKQVIKKGDGSRESHDGGQQLMTMYLARSSSAFAVAQLDLVT